MKIISGKQEKPQRVILYGPEGFGKTTFASKFPKPLFLDCENGTNELDVSRIEISSYAQLKDIVQNFLIIHVNDLPCHTIVIDTIDAVERMCAEHVSKAAGKKSIEDFGYGKGYTHLAEEIARLLDLVTAVRDRGLNVVVLGHSMMRKFESPEQAGAYDRYEMSLNKKTMAVVKEWGDMVLFANYKVVVTEIDGKKKAAGGARVMYTSHHPCWDAKNRIGLPDEMPFEYDALSFTQAKPQVIVPATVKESLTVQTEPGKPMPDYAPDLPAGFPAKLWDLMTMHGVTEEDIREVVHQKGYYPFETPVHNYATEFTEGVLLSAWEQVYELVKKNRVEF